jgi:hypothetical protein
MPASQIPEATGTQMVDHIPVIWRTPQNGRERVPLALWLPALGVDKVGRPVPGPACGGGVRGGQLRPVAARRAGLGIC